MNLVTDKAIFNVSLRNACLTIACFFLASIILGVLIAPSSLSYSTSLIGFIIELIANLALLFGVLWANHWLVLVWLIHAIFFFINWPIALLGVIFHFGGYREAAYFNNIFLIIIEYIIILIVFAYCARLVYSYFRQLKDSEPSQHTVVV